MIVDIKKYIITFCCLWTLAVIQVGAQVSFDKVAQSLNEYANQNVVEKLFVHTDKDFYQAGEILWMKVYGVDGDNKPLDFSKVTYAELLDTANKSVMQAKIAMNKATGEAYFDLPQTLASGNYTLRAYTRWMKNDGPASFFEKNITVINMNRLPAILNGAGKEKEKTAIQFFPEGGNMLADVENRIAFKAISEKGGMANFKGYITDNTDTIVQFSPMRNGMGSFLLTPVSGHTYKASIVLESGNNITAGLPRAFPTGTAIQVFDRNDTYVLQGINTTADRSFHLLVHTHGHIKLSATIAENKGTFSYTINKSDLPDGVSVITIFNEALKPVCERVVFKYPEESLNLKIITSQNIYKSRRQVELDVSALQGLQETDSVNLSLSVFRLDSLQKIPQQNIYSYLWLASEVKGFIDNPDFYFSRRNEKASQALDLLLLTQGWRRFDWDKVFADQRNYAYVPEVQGHIITGRVEDSLTAVPLKDITTYLSAPSLITLFKTAVSDSSGHFKADFENFYGGRFFIAQTKGESARIKIDNPFSHQFSDKVLPLLERPLQYPNTLLQQSIATQVQHIYNEDQLYQFAFPDFADSAAFYGRPDYSYQLENYTRFRSVEEILREFVSLVDVRYKGANVNLHVVNRVQKQYFPGPPLNLLDGVPIFNFTKFFESDPLKFKSLDVVAHQYVLGNSVFDGILNWKSYQPSLDKYELDPQTTVVDYEGLLLARAFYAPVYSTPLEAESHLPDFRNVLLWQPNILLKAADISHIHFYTSDLPGRYVIVVQGISSSGRAGRGVSFFEVK